MHAIKFTEFHVDNDDMTSMPYLIMQYKPYIVELPPKWMLIIIKYVAIVSTSTLYIASN